MALTGGDPGGRDGGATLGGVPFIFAGAGGGGVYGAGGALTFAELGGVRWGGSGASGALIHAELGAGELSSFSFPEEPPPPTPSSTNAYEGPGGASMTSSKPANIHFTKFFMISLSPDMAIVPFLQVIWSGLAAAGHGYRPVAGCPS